MPLLELWKSNPETVIKFTIEQMVTMAGDGDLRDDSVCSMELRKVLAELKSQRLFDHIETCLLRGFQKSGPVLQDLVNELGRRLDYHVDNGLYSGRTNQIGFDGIWKGSDGHALVVEVKTTDAYRINLDTIAGYRSALIDAGRITPESSALIIVGRNDTGDVEAQVRGSRHAWDIRLISIDALQKLVALKERADEEETVRKIQSLLKPFEYTRLDNIIDVMFATATDVEGGASEGEAEPETPETVREVRQEHTPSHVIVALRTRIVDAMTRRTGVNLIARSRATYWSADKTVRICCSISKLHEGGGYWYAYHPHWDEFLKQGAQGFHILGCVNLGRAFAIPVGEIDKILPSLYITQREQSRYYHLHLEPQDNGGMRLKLRTGRFLDLNPYVVDLS